MSDTMDRVGAKHSGCVGMWGTIATCAFALLSNTFRLETKSALPVTASIAIARK